MPVHPSSPSRPAPSGGHQHGALGHLSAEEELQQAVCQALIADRELDSSEVGVRVTGDTVLLSGRVGTAGAKRRALRVAEGLPGVAHVDAKELRVAGAR